MSATTDIYDFETAIEEAFRTALADAGLTAHTLLTVPDAADIEASQEFQRSRPRVVVSLEVGAAKGQLLAAPGTRASSGSSREMAYGGTLTLEIVTAATIAAHREYRAIVRQVMDTICPAVNGDPVTHHKVQRVRATGSGTTYEAAGGCYAARLTYDVDFSIQAEAWNAL
jgi:hypothetical protein